MAVVVMMIKTMMIIVVMMMMMMIKSIVKLDLQCYEDNDIRFTSLFR